MTRDHKSSSEAGQEFKLTPPETEQARKEGTYGNVLTIRHVIKFMETQEGSKRNAKEIQRLLDDPVIHARLKEIEKLHWENQKQEKLHYGQGYDSHARSEYFKEGTEYQ